MHVHQSYTIFIIHGCFRWLYWTDYDAAVPKIQRVSMDGTNQTILHSTNLSAPYCLALDYSSQTLYWADYSLNKIEKSNTNGSGREVVTTSLVNDVWSLTFYNENLYWTDLSHDRIFTAPVDNSSTSTFLYNGVIGDIYGIKAVAKEQQPQGNCSTIIP